MGKISFIVILSLIIIAGAIAVVFILRSKPSVQATSSSTVQQQHDINAQQQAANSGVQSMPALNGNSCPANYHWVPGWGNGICVKN